MVSILRTFFSGLIMVYRSYHHFQTTTSIGPETILSWSQPDVPHQQLQSLKKGAFHWTAHLDLHGHYVDFAFEKLTHFLHQSYQSGHRMILIIHGKGGLKSEASILKTHVYEWLQASPYVLALHSALPRHGGAGAMYVMLKKKSNASF